MGVIYMIRWSFNGPQRMVREELKKNRGEKQKVLECVDTVE